MNKQRIPPVDPATASGTNKKNFDVLKCALGFIPNMALAMAQSPAVLDGYMGLSVALIKGRLGKRLGEELALTLTGTNHCEYCASLIARLSKSRAFLSGPRLQRLACELRSFSGSVSILLDFYLPAGLHMQVLSGNGSICKYLTDPDLMVEPLQCLDKGKPMPRVRIDVRKGKDVGYR
jgi:hypothetical protein